MGDRIQGPSAAGGVEPKAKVESSQGPQPNQPLSGLRAGINLLSDIANGARRKIAQNSPNSLAGNPNTPAVQAERGSGSNQTTQEPTTSTPQEPGPATLATQLPLDLKRDYGLDLQYVRHHIPDSTTREGHFLKAGVREYFWDPNKGQLLSWNSAAKQWETVLPKRDEAAGQRLLASDPTKKMAEEDVAAYIALKKKISSQSDNTGANPKNTPASILEPDKLIEQARHVVNERRNDVLEYGAGMEVLDIPNREKLARKEAIIDAIAKICQKQELLRTDDEKEFIRSTGLDLECFLRLYKAVCEARERDAKAQQQHAGNKDTQGLVSLERLNNVDFILQNSFSKSINDKVVRLNSSSEPRALKNFMSGRKLAV